MILTQKYHSLFDIDEEFISSIELLLEDEVVDFNWLLENEQNSSKDEFFTYYLFFGENKNATIGFSSIKTIPIK